MLLDRRTDSSRSRPQGWLGNLAELHPDVALASICAHRFREHANADFELRRHLIEYRSPTRIEWLEIVATYSRRDLEQIAAAIHTDVTHVCRHEKQFEAAAMWYRLDRNALKNQRITPFVMRRRMRQISDAARKLLRHLGVEDPAQAPDGPRIAVLEVLASTDDGTEDAVVRATTRIGRLVEILEAVDAARELARRAEMGAEDVLRIGNLTVPKGHHGDAAVNDWIAAMMSIYKQITGKDPGISIVAPSRRGRGKAAGPLIRFLKTAGKPIGIQFSPDSFAGRIKDVRTGGAAPKKIDSIAPFRRCLL